MYILEDLDLLSPGVVSIGRHIGFCVGSSAYGRLAGGYTRRRGSRPDDGPIFTVPFVPSERRERRREEVRCGAASSLRKTDRWTCERKDGAVWRAFTLDAEVITDVLILKERQDYCLVSVSSFAGHQLCRCQLFTLLNPICNYMHCIN